jgi:V/A-type H+-transporting ATPase subunit D
MGKTSLGKMDLQKERQRLKLFLKMLPSIDLKRSQLMAEYAHAKKERDVLQNEYDLLKAEAGKVLPMMANRDVNLNGLVKISSVVIEEQSIVGVKVPWLQQVAFEEFDYALLATPYWLEAYIKTLKKAIEARFRIQTMNVRIEKLSYAVRKITQHFNLFEKILIPNAKKNIQKIQILLGEADRNAVVRSKIAKALHSQDRNRFFEDHRA